MSNRSVSDQPHPIHALADRWRKSAEVLREWGATSQAAVLERAASELDGWMDEYIRPADAAREQPFYAESTIRTMLSDGRLTNWGEPGRPLIRRGDLWGTPRRPVVEAVMRRLVGAT